jgi:uncharacterized protein (TIGR03790 family)
VTERWNDDRASDTISRPAADIMITLHPRVAIVFLAVCLCAAATSFAQSAENVAVIVNESSAESQRIGEHYARLRGLPATNILRISTSTEETIERGVFISTIERPIGNAISRAGLQDRLLYLVLTKGVPLRIAGTTGLKGTGASVDSELTVLYRKLTGAAVATPGQIDNPYFLGTRDITAAKSFSHRDHDIYLVTRLDGFTADDAIALVDRGASPRREGTFVLDQRASAAGPATGDEWIAQAALRLRQTGHERHVVLESTAKASRDVDQVLGYFAWGAADPEQRVRRSGMKFAPGAIAASLGSFDARTFRAPADEWRPTASGDKASLFAGSGDALIGDLIADGVTGVSGQVGEAYLLGAVRPDILFPAYAAGFNLVEAFYLAMPTLGWQAVVIGDPLCAPFPRARLTRAEIEAPMDSTTALPGWFSSRRLASMAAANAGVPAASVATVVRAMALLDRDDKLGAARSLAEALTLTEGVFTWRAVIGSLQEQAGDYDAAVANYRGVLEAQPSNVVALNNLAYALAVHEGKASEGLPFAMRAFALAPRDPDVADTLGWIRHLLGNHDEALRLIQASLATNPGRADIRVHLGLIYAELGNREKAQGALDEALRVNPSIAEKDDTRRLKALLEAKP